MGGVGGGGKVDVGRGLCECGGGGSLMSQGVCGCVCACVCVCVYACDMSHHLMHTLDGTFPLVGLFYAFNRSLLHLCDAYA